MGYLPSSIFHVETLLVLVIFFLNNFCFSTIWLHRKWGISRNVTCASRANREGPKRSKPKQRCSSLPRRCEVCNWLPQGAVLPWPHWRIRGSTRLCLDRQDREGCWLLRGENKELAMKECLQVVLRALAFSCFIFLGKARLGWAF
jgi:hypothetical protein